MNWIEKEHMMFNITPVAKGRPRATSCGGYVRMYTPMKTQVYEQQLANLYVKNGGKKHSGPLFVKLEFFFAPSKSETKKNRQLMLEGKIQYTKKNDIDNMVKSAADSWNGIAYDDDSQIVKLEASKQYAEQDGILLTIFEGVEDDASNCQV